MKRIIAVLLASGGLLLSATPGPAHESGPASATHLFLMHPFDSLDPMTLAVLIGIGAAGLWATWRMTR